MDREARPRRGVVIGNIYDMERERVARFRKRIHAFRQTIPSDVWDAETGSLVGPEDETGLTVHHEIDPELKQDLTKFVDTAKNRGVWLAAIGGVIAGLLLAGLAWWFAQQVKGGRRR